MGVVTPAARNVSKNLLRRGNCRKPGEAPSRVRTQRAHFPVLPPTAPAHRPVTGTPRPGPPAPARQTAQNKGPLPRRPRQTGQGGHPVTCTDPQPPLPGQPGTAPPAHFPSLLPANRSAPGEDVPADHGEHRRRPADPRDRSRNGREQPGQPGGAADSATDSATGRQGAARRTGRTAARAGAALQPRHAGTRLADLPGPALPAWAHLPGPPLRLGETSPRRRITRVNRVRAATHRVPMHRIRQRGPTRQDPHDAPQPQPPAPRGRRGGEGRGKTRWGTRRGRAVRAVFPSSTGTPGWAALLCRSRMPSRGY